jgi:hypothetical protein
MSARVLALLAAMVGTVIGRKKIAAQLTKLTGTWVGESR